MVTQFTLRKQKQNKAGECPIYLMVYFDEARLKCATGEKCRPADWNAERQQFCRSYSLPDEVNDLLTLMAGTVLAWWRKLRPAGGTPTLAGLREALRLVPAPEAAVLQPVAVLYEQYCQAMRARGHFRESQRQGPCWLSTMAPLRWAIARMLEPGAAPYDRPFTLTLKSSLPYSTKSLTVAGPHRSY